MRVTLVPRKNTHRTTFYLFYSTPHGRVREKTELFYLNDATKEKKAKVKILAESMRSKRQEELNFGTAGVFNRDQMAMLFEQHIETILHSTDSKSEANRYRYMLHHLNKYAGRGIAFSRINEQFCRLFRSYLKTNLAPETAYGYLRAFKSALTIALRMKLIRENPMVGIPAIPKGLPQVKKEVLTPDEILTLKSTLCQNEQVRRAALLQLRTGMGTAEIRVLRAKQVSVSRMEITYVRQKNVGKNLPPVVVPITRESLNLLGDLSDPERILFHLPTKRYLNKILQDWVTAAGILKKITPYCLRHSCIQNLMDMGVQDSTIIEIVGHSDYRMLRRYARASDERKREAISKLG